MTEEQEVFDAWRVVQRRGAYVLGPELAAFERELASYIGVGHAVGVSSGTDALTLALRVIGVDHREVIVPALTFIATAEAVILAGGVPVFADVDAETWCMTPETVAPHLSAKTAALLPVDLFGSPAPIPDLKRMGIPVVEDACQAIGASLDGEMCGALGDIGCTSFYPSKLLAGFGDGGAVFTDNDAWAGRLRRLRSHGSLDNRLHQLIGQTARLDELQAAGLRVRLRHLDDRLREHQRRGSGDQRVVEGGVSACHQTVRLGEGPGRSFYRVPCHLQPAMRPFYRAPLPNAERFSRSNHAEPPISQPTGTPETLVA